MNIFKLTKSVFETLDIKCIITCKNPKLLYRVPETKGVEPIILKYFICVYKSNIII